MYLLTTPENKGTKIRLGLLKGMKWIYSSGYTDYWMGTYGKEVAQIFSKYAKKSKIIYDSPGSKYRLLFSYCNKIN